jgi:hypothetical protein
MSIVLTANIKKGHYKMSLAGEAQPGQTAVVAPHQPQLQNGSNNPE